LHGLLPKPSSRIRVNNRAKTRTRISAPPQIASHSISKKAPTNDTASKTAMAMTSRPAKRHSAFSSYFSRFFFDMVL